jgi:hypothetical protein
VAEVARVAGGSAEVGARKLRQHVFWECPVAQAVLQEVQAGVPGGTQLLRQHVWLGLAPCSAIRLAVWRVVCIAALGAMDKGRRCLWCLHHKQLDQQAAAVGQDQELRQLSLWEAWGVAPSEVGHAGDEQGQALQPVSPLLRACRAAVQDFWARLQQFVSGLPPVPPPRPGARDSGGHPKWVGSSEVGVEHAFIRRVGQAAPPQFMVALPDGAAAGVLEVQALEVQGLEEA